MMNRREFTGTTAAALALLALGVRSGPDEVHDLTVETDYELRYNDGFAEYEATNTNLRIEWDGETIVTDDFLISGHWVAAGLHEAVIDWRCDDGRSGSVRWILDGKRVSSMLMEITKP